MSLSDRDALLAAVRAAPDDDLPRLVYADWCEDHGDPDRAAFVRLQVERDRAEPYSPTWRAAAERAQQLGSRHHPAWTAHLRGQVRKARFVRGFVGHVLLDADQFPDSAALDAEPIRSAQVVRHPGRWAVDLAAAFASPRLARLTALDFTYTYLSEPEYDALFGSPHLRGLTDLSLRNNPVPPQRLVDFFAGDALPNLAGLDLTDNANLRVAVAEGLARAGHRRLRRLDLSGVQFSWENLQRVLAAPALREVEELRLAAVADPGPLRHLEIGWVIPWGRLRLLDLSGHGVGPAGVREIARTPGAAVLRWLRLAANGLDPDAVGYLVDSKYLNLYYLDVRNNGLAPEELAALRRRFPDALVLG